MQLVTWLQTVPPDSIGVLLPKLSAPLPNRLVGDEKPALKHHFYHHSYSHGQIKKQLGFHRYLPHPNSKN